MEARLFEEGTIPECATAEWYAERETAPHVEQEAHRGRLELAVEHVESLDEFWDPYEGFRATVSDLGCGDGGLLSLLAGRERWGYDLQQSNVDASARLNVDVRYGNVLEDDVEYGDIVVCTEMLEHLVDPHGLVENLMANNAVGAVVASSPFTETAESHYAFHLWAWNMDGYRAMLEAAGWIVTRHETWSMFQVITGVKPGWSPT